MIRDTEDVVALLAKASPLFNCGHRANRPNPRVSGERIVGFVIGENDIGMGLSEPLFALDALVKLAMLSQSLSDRIDVLEGHLLSMVHLAETLAGDVPLTISSIQRIRDARAALHQEGS